MIVGSGAGGGATAAVLAGAGLDVVVVESGDYYDDQDFDGSELGAITRYYMAAPTATHDQSVGLLAGSCLGGGTVVNYTTSFRTPDDVRAEWASHGVPAFTSDDYTASLDAVCERLGVNQEYNDPSTREQKLRDGCLALGWHVDAMPRGVRKCAQGKECGYCGLGCRVGAKQSVVKTWLADAHGAGTRLVVRSRVQKVLVEGGSARGIVGVTAEGKRLDDPLTRRGRGLRGDPHARAAQAIRAEQRQHRQAPAAAPRDRGVRRLRRGAQALGGRDAGALLRSVPRPARRLRAQVRDRGRASRTCSSGSRRGAAPGITSR